jgi:Adenylosuccinate lyase
VLQFGGAAGTLAALDDRGLDIPERLAALLDLPLPEAPWHSHRDRLAEVASASRSSPAPAARSPAMFRC